MQTPKISIVILNWNRKQDTLECLTSTLAIQDPHFEVICVDNGSTDGSSAAIRAQFPSVRLIENGANLGFAEGNNVGIRDALTRNAEFVFLLNNDTVVDPNLLQAFRTTFQTYPKAGILGAKIYLYDERKTLDHLGGKWNAQKGIFEFIGLRSQEDGISWETPQAIDYVCGAAFMIKRSVFEAIGSLEKDFFLFWEEADFCFRARRAGFQVLTCPKAHIWHRVSASFIGGKPHSTYFWWRGRFLFIARNCSKLEKKHLFWRVLLPEILHLYKMRWIKWTELKLLRLFRSRKDLQEKERKQLKNSSALAGIQDYYLGRFGSGPAWIYQKR